MVCSCLFPDSLVTMAITVIYCDLLWAGLGVGTKQDIKKIKSHPQGYLQSGEKGHLHRVESLPHRPWVSIFS